MDKLYFFNTPFAMEEEDLHRFLRDKVGPVPYLKIFRESPGDDAQGFIIFRNTEQTEKAMQYSGDEFMGRKIFFRFPWSSIDQFVKMKKQEDIDSPSPANIVQPVEFNIFERGKCVTDLPGRFEAISFSTENKSKNAKGYWKQVQECERFFGKGDTKPQDMNETMAQEILQANSQQINVGSHPLADMIKEIKIDKQVFSKLSFEYDLFEDSKGILVTTVSHLRDVVAHLAEKKVIGLDLEGYDRGVYRSTTSIIQISTDQHNYIIDACAYLMRPAIKTGLRYILECPNTWKIMSGLKSDNLAMQRDFGIYLFPVIELQIAMRFYLELLGEKCLVCHKLTSLCRRGKHGSVLQECLETSFDKIFTHFYPKLEMSKIPQKANWCTRPIHNDLLRYATLDSALALNIWDKMAVIFRERSKPTTIHDNVVVPSNILLLQLNPFEKEEEDIEKFARKNFKFGEAKEIGIAAMKFRNYVGITTNKPVSEIWPEDAVVKFVNLYVGGADNSTLIGQLQEHFSTDNAVECIESIQNKRLPELIAMEESEITCTRCKQKGHVMKVCTAERVRTGDDRKKDKERYREKRKAARESAFSNLRDKNM